jgi:hypothetical protein
MAGVFIIKVPPEKKASVYKEYRRYTALEIMLDMLSIYSKMSQRLIGTNTNTLMPELHSLKTITNLKVFIIESEICFSVATVLYGSSGEFAIQKHNFFKNEVYLASQDGVIDGWKVFLSIDEQSLGRVYTVENASFSESLRSWEALNKYCEIRAQQTRLYFDEKNQYYLAVGNKFSQSVVQILGGGQTKSMVQNKAEVDRLPYLQGITGHFITSDFTIIQLNFPGAVVVISKDERISIFQE